MKVTLLENILWQYLNENEFDNFENSYFHLISLVQLTWINNDFLSEVEFRWGLYSEYSAFKNCVE